jgi:CHAT domain-containing protein/tetratricopeptide (TPR) repeat protein
MKRVCLFVFLVVLLVCHASSKASGLLSIPTARQQLGDDALKKLMDEAKANLNAGQHQSALEKYTQAATEYNARQDKRGLFDARLGAAQATGKLGQVEEAITILRDVRAQAQAAGDRLSEARSYTAETLIRPSASQITEEEIANLKKAEAIFHELKDSEREMQVVGLLAVKLYLNARYDQAIEYLRKSAAAYTSPAEAPRRAQLLVLLGSSQQKFGDVASAVKSLSEALALAQNLQNGNLIAAIAYQLGNLQSDEDDYTAAIINLKLAIETSGDPAEIISAYQKLGYCYNQLGRRDEAISAVRAGWQLAEKSAPAQAASARSFYAVYLAFDGKPDEALAEFGAVLTGKPDEKTFDYVVARLEALAQSMADAGNPSATGRAYQLLIEHYKSPDKRRLRWLIRLGEETSAGKQFDAAFLHFQEAAQLSKTLKDNWQQKRALEGLGRIRQAQNKRSEAIAYFSQAGAIKVSLSNVAAIIEEIKTDKDSSRLAYLNRTTEDGLLVGEQAAVIAFGDHDQKDRNGRRIGTARIVEVENGKLAAQITLNDPQKDQFYAGDVVEAVAVLPFNPRPGPLLRVMLNGAALADQNHSLFITLQELIGNDSEQAVAEIYRKMLADLRPRKDDSVLRLMNPIAEGRYKGRTPTQVLSEANENDLLSFFYFLIRYPNQMRGQYKLSTAFLTWAVAGGPPGTEELVNGALALKGIDEQRRYLAPFRAYLQGSYAIDEWSNVVEQKIDQQQYEQAEALARILPVIGEMNDDQALRREVEAAAHFLLAKVYSAAGKPNDSIAQYKLAADLWQGNDLKNYAAAVGNLALEYRSLGRFKEDVEHYQMAVKAIDEYYAKNPNELDRVRWVVKHLGLSKAYSDQSRYEEALKHYNRSLEILGDEPGANALEYRAGIFDNIGYILSKRGEYKQSIIYYEKAQTLRAKLKDENAAALSLSNIGSGYWNLGDYRAALDYYEQALFKRKITDNRSGVAETLTNIGELNWKLGNYETATGSYDKALATYRDLNDAEKESGVYLKIGSLKRDAGQYNDAVTLFEQALKLRQKIGKLDSIVEIRNELGDVYFSQTNYGEAEKNYQQAYKLQQELGNRAEEARALENLSASHFWLHDTDRSFDEAQRALKLWQEVGDAQGIISALHRVGNGHRFNARWKEATLHYEQALALAVKTESKSLEAESLTRMAEVIWSQGKIREALDLYRKAFAIYDLLGDQTNKASALAEISAVLYELAEYNAAEKEINLALDLARKTHTRTVEARALAQLSYIAATRGDIRLCFKLQQDILKIYQETNNEFGQANTIATIARIYDMTGDLKQALTNKTDVMARFQKLRSRVDQMDVYVDLAATYQALRNFPEAIKNLNNALAMERELNFPSLRLRAFIALGAIYARLANYDEALRWLNEATPIAASLGQRTEIINVQFKQGWVYRLKGDYQKATELLNQALAAAKQLDANFDVFDIEEELGMAEYHAKDYKAATAHLDAALSQRERQSLLNEMWEPLYYRGLVERDQGNNPEAIKHWTRAVEIVERLRGQTGSDAAEALYQSDKNNLYSDLIDLLLKQQNCADCENRAWQYLARSKSSELATIFGNSFKQARTAQERAIVGQAQTFQTRELALRRQLDEERRKPSAGRNQESLDRIAAQLRIVQADYDRYTKSLDADQKKLVQIEPEDFRQIQKSLQKGEVFIEPMALGDRIVIFAVRWGANVPLIYRETRVDEREVNETMQKLREALSHPEQRFGAVRAEREDTDATAKTEDPLVYSERLYDWLIKPVLPEIADATTLIISPSGRLRYIPFATLHDGAQYLIERYQIAVLTRAGSIGISDERGLDMSDMKMLALSNPAPVSAPLPGADTEVDRLRQLFGGNESVRIFKHAEANKKNLLDTLFDYQILHLATHGYLNNESPDQSYILLAGDKDQRLTFDEIGRLEVGQMRLVTLSACQTALGDKAQGQEIAGLAYGFEKAGAATIIASLWSVNDESTKELMIGFYSNLKAGMPKARAMQEAQKSLMKSARFRHPYYWAPFLVIGSWK